MRQTLQQRDKKRYRPDRDGPMRMQAEANKKIVVATQSVCAICGGIVDKSLKAPHPMSASVDHIIPIAKGGHPSDINNLQLTHRACNRAKGTKIITEKPQREVAFAQSADWRKA